MLEQDHDVLDHSGPQGSVLWVEGLRAQALPLGQGMRGLLLLGELGVRQLRRVRGAGCLPAWDGIARGWKREELVLPLLLWRPDVLVLKAGGNRRIESEEEKPQKKCA